MPSPVPPPLETGDLVGGRYRLLDRIDTGGMAEVWRAQDIVLSRPVAVKALASCSSLRGLRVLNLTNNLVGDAGAAALASSRSLAGLLELDLRDSDVRDAGAMALAESPHLENLLRLDLRNRDHRELSQKASQALRERFGDRVCL